MNKTTTKLVKVYILYIHTQQRQDLDICSSQNNQVFTLFNTKCDKTFFFQK